MPSIYFITFVELNKQAINFTSKTQYFNLTNTRQRNALNGSTLLYVAKWNTKWTDYIPRDKLKLTEYSHLFHFCVCQKFSWTTICVMIAIHTLLLSYWYQMIEKKLPRKWCILPSQYSRTWTKSEFVSSFFFLQCLC